MSADPGAILSDPPSPFPLAYRDFRIYWAGYFVSFLGSQMTPVAIQWQVYLLTGKDPFALGAIGLAKAVPMILMALVGGVVADAVDRRRLLLVTQSIYLLLSLVLAGAARWGVTHVGLLYGVMGLTGALMALDLPARQALVPNLVPREVLPRALSVNITSMTLAQIAGPALGGVLLGHGGPAFVYAIDAATFLVFLTALASVRYRRDEAKKPLVRPTIGAAVEGIRFLRGQPILWATMWIDFLATFFAGCMHLMPIFANDVFRVGETGLGVLLAAPALGAFVTSGWFAFHDPPRRQGLAVLVSVAVFGLASAAFGATGSFPLAIALLALSGAADSVSMVVRNTLRQELTPDEMRGRMVSVNMIFFAGGPQLGEAEAGFVAKHWSPRGSVVSGGLACALVALAYAVLRPDVRGYVRARRG